METETQRIERASERNSASMGGATQEARRRMARQVRLWHRDYLKYHDPRDFELARAIAQAAEFAFPKY